MKPNPNANPIANYQYFLIFLGEVRHMNFLSQSINSMTKKGKKIIVSLVDHTIIHQCTKLSKNTPETQYSY